MRHSQTITLMRRIKRGVAVLVHLADRVLRALQDRLVPVDRWTMDFDEAERRQVEVLVHRLLGDDMAWLRWEPRDLSLYGMVGGFLTVSMRRLPDWADAQFDVSRRLVAAGDDFAKQSGLAVTLFKVEWPDGGDGIEPEFVYVEEPIVNDEGK